MAKNIVFCADGTWNHPHSPVTVEECDTNVYKLYKALSYTSSQVTTYDDGVGSDGLAIVKMLGGAFGIGLFEKIKQGYTALAHQYEQGDKIYIFGFSRGAYTARSLAGMIAASGLPTKNFDDICVNLAFEAYRQKPLRPKLLEELNTRYSMDQPTIAMLGVWDTVGALGIPGALFGHSEDDVIYGFLDTGLNKRVEAAYHALSIDERRGAFVPTLWTGDPAPGQIVEQVWFAGAHCDVGGGYNECELSNITLGWMMQKAKLHGLEFVDAAWKKYGVIDPQYALKETHESWNLFWGLPNTRELPANATISDSVLLRLQSNPKYRPSNLNYDGSGKLIGYKVDSVVGPGNADAAIAS